MIDSRDLLIFESVYVQYICMYVVGVWVGT